MKQNIIISLAAALGIGAVVPGFIAYPDREPVYPATQAQSMELGRRWTAGNSPFAPVPPSELTAPSIFLVDTESGDVLYEKSADRPIPPASLTKLFTMNQTVNALQSGGISWDEWYSVPPEAYATAMEVGSSLMFLGRNQRVTVADLLNGLAVSSGNDAAVATALLLYDSIDEFAVEVNRLNMELGLEDTYIEEPSGISAENRSTAEDLARFARYVTLTWPREVSEILAHEEFTYPRPENTLDPTVEVSWVPIRQENRNILLRSYPGVDGMKTGFIDESGYNLIARLNTDDSTYIAVVLGIHAPDHRTGGERRAMEAVRLFDWVRDTYVRVPLETPELDSVDVRGSKENLTLHAAREASILLPRESIAYLHGEIHLYDATTVPVNAGEILGTLEYLLRRGDTTVTLETIPLVADRSVRTGVNFQSWYERYSDLVSRGNGGGESALAQ